MTPPKLSSRERRGAGFWYATRTCVMVTARPERGVLLGSSIQQTPFSRLLVVGIGEIPTTSILLILVEDRY